jgi:hypothetical protein
MGCVFLTPFGPDRDGADRSGTGNLATVAVHARAGLRVRNPQECSALNSSSRDERDSARRNLGTVLDRAGFRLEPAAVYFDMLKCSDALEELVAKYADRYSSEEECRRNVLLGAVYLGLVGMRESDAATSEGVTTLCYVAGPFSASTRAGVDQNIRRAVDLGVEVAKLGAYPVIPHANTADPRFEHVQPYEFWIDATMAMLRPCEALITVAGWEASSGARGEVAYQRKREGFVAHSIEALARYLQGYE